MNNSINNALKFESMPTQNASFHKIALIAFKDDALILPTIKRIQKLLNTHADVFVHAPDLKQFIPNDQQSSIEYLQQNADLIISIGGDGTLLNCARAFVNFNIPLLGINLGRLGFLADVSLENLDDSFLEILRGEFTKEERFFIQGDIESESNKESSIALNDIILHSREAVRMIEFEVFSNHQLIHRQRADGLIVSTPTGSTAYSLSGGGPIIHPSLDVLAIVPICPHTLSNRPIILPSNKHIEINVIENSTPTQISFDGQSNQLLSANDKLTIHQFEKKITLLHPKNYDYFEILRAKLNWSTPPQ